MKTSSNNLLNSMSKESLDNLTREVKETIAMGFGEKTSKSFSTAELWNIQRQQRTLTSRRRYM